jgi:hypothetical protein
VRTGRARPPAEPRSLNVTYCRGRGFSSVAPALCAGQDHGRRPSQTQGLTAVATAELSVYSGASEGGSDRAGEEGRAAHPEGSPYLEKDCP